VSPLSLPEHRPARELALVLSCEHATHHVPAPYDAKAVGWERVLLSHNGWDPGALELARELARTLDAPLHAAEAARLLVDTNRSETSPELLSGLLGPLSADEREALLARWYRPHREAVEASVRAALATAEVAVHVGVHSFTPILHGHRRSTVVGFLFDPERSAEEAFCRRWRAALRRLEPDLVLHLNEPYRGDSDGLTRTLRRRFSPLRYLGLELEVNQCLPLTGGPRWESLRKSLAASLAQCLAEHEPRWPAPLAS